MITVLSPGSRTLVQDAGRPGYEHLGVPISGAADPGALALANRLAENPEDAAALEVTFTGPSLRFDTAATVAYAGPETDLWLDGVRVPTHHTLVVAPGQTLTVGTLRRGLYGYLAVRGGIDTDLVLGSRSTCTLSGLGPAPLAAGSTLPLNRSHAPARFRAARVEQRGIAPVLRCLPGPHADLFTRAHWHRLFAEPWTIAPASSRVGVRFTQSLPQPPQDSIPSLGMVRGAIQIPPTGTPIVLGPDHGTTGGYPVIAVVHPDDLPTLMQQRPGDAVRLTAESAASETATAQVFVLDLLSA